MERFYIVYVTTNNLNGKIYVGSHSCFTLEDGYLGSGKVFRSALKKYGRANFSRIVIATIDNLEDAREFEELAVQEAITRLGRMCYNRSWSGTGAVAGEGNAFFGKQHSKETKEKLSKHAKSRTGEANPFYGKTHSKKAIEKMQATKKMNPVSKDILSRAQSKYLWYTPIGVFYSCYVAAEANGLGANLIKKWCTNSDRMINPNYQIPEKFWGRTAKENGFLQTEARGRLTTFP
jgi:group I intron endonuclease